MKYQKYLQNKKGTVATRYTGGNDALLASQLYINRIFLSQTPFGAHFKLNEIISPITKPPILQYKQIRCC